MRDITPNRRPQQHPVILYHFETGIAMNLVIDLVVDLVCALAPRGLRRFAAAAFGVFFMVLGAIVVLKR